MSDFFHIFFMFVYVFGIYPFFVSTFTENLSENARLFLFISIFFRRDSTGDACQFI